MSLLAPPLASLVLFSGLAVAQIVAPNCNTTWKWSFNTLGQNPCTVAAYMLSTCNGGSFTIEALPPGYMYYGPNGADDSNLCKCNTVAYSLMSACGGCQGAEWVTWLEYSLRCTETLPPSSFPNPIPAGTRVPHWVLLDPTDENLWDFNKSFLAGDSPELGPGTILGPSVLSVLASGSTKAVSATGSSTSHRPTATPIYIGGGGSKTGTIVGGIVGGIAIICILVAALFFLLGRCRSLVSSATPVGVSSYRVSRGYLDYAPDDSSSDF